MRTGFAKTKVVAKHTRRRITMILLVNTIQAPQFFTIA
jgi:hypothetical protein